LVVGLPQLTVSLGSPRFAFGDRLLRGVCRCVAARYAFVLDRRSAFIAVCAALLSVIGCRPPLVADRHYRFTPEKQRFPF
jgi:hypothetical protein